MVWLTTAGLALILAGCNGKEQSGSSAYIDREAQLLKQIDGKFENPQAHYQLGKIYHADGLWNKAEYEYNTAIGFDPVHWLAQAAKVKLLTDAGQAQRASAAAQMYINQAGVSAQNSSLLGKAFEAEGLDEYALTCYRQGLDIEPDSAALYKQLGYYYLTRGDKIRAEEHFRQSFQLNPYQSDVAGELGKMGVTVQVPGRVEQERAPAAAPSEEKVQ
jgi:tetratricopeptide (TPR) repeat protein